MRRPGGTQHGRQHRYGQHQTAARGGGAVLVAVLVATVILGGTAAPAAAQSLDQLRAQGAVCERPDGLLRALSSDPTVQQTVDRINQERLATYRRLAQEKNATVEQVRIVSGEKLQGKYGACP